MQCNQYPAYWWADMYSDLIDSREYLGYLTSNRLLSVAYLAEPSFNKMAKSFETFSIAF